MLPLVAVLVFAILAVCGADNTVLISSGAGFLGRHFTHRFCQAGWHVTVLDSLDGVDALPLNQWPQELQCPPGSIHFLQERNLDFFRRTHSPNKEEEWTIFLHLISARRWRNISDWSETEMYFSAVQENIETDTAAFEWAAGHGTRRTVLKMISFNSMVESELIMSPSLPGLGIPHVLSRQTGRVLAPALHRSHSLNVVLYEAQIVYGEDVGTSSAFRSAVRLAAAKRDPLVVEHDATLDFLHVEDAVQGVFLSVNQVHDGSVVRLLSGSPSNMTAVAMSAARLSKYSPSVITKSVVDEELLGSFLSPGAQVQLCTSTRSLEGVVALLLREEIAALKEQSSLPPPPVYSSFHCSGGNQQFPDMKPYNDLSLAMENKVCQLHNVCLQNAQVMYYQHPEETRAPAFVQVVEENMVKMGITQSIAPDLSFGLNVLPGQAMPPAHSFIDPRTWFLVLASYSDGVGHHLLDDLFPVIAAADMFDISLEDVALLYSGCELLDYFGEACAYDPSKLRGEVCHENFETFSQIVFGSRAMPLGDVHEDRSERVTCFKSMVVGQNYVFNVDTVDKQRAVTLRKGRDLIINNVRNSRHVADSLLSIKDKFLILILPKNNPGYQQDALWDTLCDDVYAMVVGLGLDMSEVAVVCKPSGSSMEREVEIMLVNHASLIVAEHGTLSLLAAFYGRDGAVLLTVGSSEAIKSAETLPFALHLYVLYTTVQRTDMAEMVRYSVHLAATNRKFSLVFSNHSSTEGVTPAL